MSATTADNRLTKRCTYKFDLIKENNMKNKLAILLLGLSLILTACGNKKVEEPKTEDPKTTEEGKTETDPTKTEGEDSEGTEKPAEGEEPLEGEDTEETEEPEEVSQEEQEAAKSREEQVNTLIKSSDYISIVKKSQTGATGSDMQVIEDFKGSLKNIEFPEVKGIEANKEYLVFFRDSDTGIIILTDEATGLHEITATNDPVLEQVRENFAVEETNEENTNTGNQNNG